MPWTKQQLIRSVCTVYCMSVYITHSWHITKDLQNYHLCPWLEYDIDSLFNYISPMAFRKRGLYI